MRSGLLLLGVCAGLLGGCSGGSAPPPPPPPQPPVPLSVTLTPTSQAVQATEENSEATFSFEAVRSGTDTGPLVADVQYPQGLMSLVGGIVEAGNRYTATFRTRSDLGAGARGGTITFRLCRESACVNVVPNTTRTFDFLLSVPVSDWTAWQRNAAHTGHVRIALPIQSYAKVWEWAPDFTESVSVASTQGDSLFVTRRGTDNTSSTHALGTRTGSVKWTHNFGSVHDASPPAVRGGRVFVAAKSMSSEINPLFVLDAATGQFVRRMDFAAQWSIFAPPTPLDDELFFTAGTFGGETYSWAAATGALRWSGQGGGYSVWDGHTPAVDATRVYSFGGETLNVFDRATGVRTHSIANPFFTWNGGAYRGGPMLGANGNVIVNTGSTIGARYTMAWPSTLASFSVSAGAPVWRSADLYQTVPALAKGVIYVARNSPARLDALSEQTGAILWSWTPPAGEQFIANIVVTDSHVFTSTDRSLYAISLTDPARPVDWKVDTPGFLSISSDLVLIVAVRGRNESPTNRLVAYEVRAS